MEQDDPIQKLAEYHQIWEKHKSANTVVAENYKGSAFDEYYQRIKRCSESLVFQVKSGKLNLDRAQFCRVRHCPICQWRKSLKWKARAYQALPEIVQDFPTSRWLFLTLTVKNCPIEELRDHIGWMHTSFKRMTRYKAWCANGWIKSTEVTKGQDGFAHPHFHCLLIVPASYFSGRKYLSHEKWIQLWQRGLGVDYKPSINVQAIKVTENFTAIIPEILKYQTKVQDLAGDSDWLIKLTEQLYSSRSVGVGGVLREYFSIRKYEGTDKNEVEGLLRLRWQASEKKYNLEL